MNSLTFSPSSGSPSQPGPNRRLTLLKLIRKTLLLLTLAGSSLQLLGCDPPLTAKRTVEKVGPVEIAEDAYFLPLPLTDTPMAGSFNQTITTVFRDNHQTFLSQLEIDQEHLTMVGLATFGARIFTMKYDGERLDFATIPQVASKIRPEILLAEFQLASWPLAPIKEQMDASTPKTYWLTAPRKLEIEENKDNRSIYFGGLKIINIDYRDGEDGSKEIVFRNLDRGYTLHITQFSESDF